MTDTIDVLATAMVSGARAKKKSTPELLLSALTVYSWCLSVRLKKILFIEAYSFPDEYSIIRVSERGAGIEFMRSDWIKHLCHLDGFPHKLLKSQKR